MTEDPELEALRAELAGVDRTIVQAVNRRIELVLAVKERKAELGLPFIDRGQEQVVLDRLARTSRGPLTGHGLRDLVRVLLDLSKREAARAAARGQAVRRRNVAAPTARRIPPTITATSTANRVPSEPEPVTRAGAT